MGEKISKVALKKLSMTDLKDFDFDHEELQALGNWTYIGMFLHEAERSLLLSKDLNDKGKFTEMDQSILSHGMFRNAILSYCKCYGRAANGKVSLDSKAIFEDQSEIKAVHEKMMDIRNSFIAHNGVNEIDIAIIALKESAKELELAQTYTLSTPLSDFDDFLRVIGFVQAWLVVNFNRKLDKIELRLRKKIIFKQT
jgi:hypothetical protein